MPPTETTPDLDAALAVARQRQQEAEALEAEAAAEFEGASGRTSVARETAAECQREAARVAGNASWIERLTEQLLQRRKEAPTYSMGTQKGPHTQLSELENLRKPGDSSIMRSIYPAAVADDESREPPCDRQVEPGSRLDGKTKDGRAMTRSRGYLPGTNRGISTADYAAGLKKGREAMATSDRAAPAATARMTAADFAALRVNKRQTA